MPVLLLSRGDAEAKDLLRRAIDARYGFRPPALDTLEINFRGRVQAKVGPVKTWLPTSLTTRFRFPLALQLTHSINVARSSLGHGAEAFDGEVYRRQQGGDPPARVDDDALVASMRRRAWALNALLLTPLTEHFVELMCVNELAFDAVHTLNGDTARLTLHSDYTLAQVSIVCVNPDTGEEDIFNLVLSDGQSDVNDLILPGKVSIFWGDKPYLELTPVAAVVNPAFPNGVFTLETLNRTATLKKTGGLF
jgi:hypothetical protein